MLDNPQPINGSLLAQRSGGWFEGYARAIGEQARECLYKINRGGRKAAGMVKCLLILPIHSQ